MLNEIEKFVNWVRCRNPHARTWRDYRYDLNQFMAVVGDQPAEAITFHEADRFVIQQGERGFKASTINRRLAAVMAFYTFLSDENPRLVCPVLPHRHKLRNPSRLPRPVQAEALGQFFAVIDNPRDRAMFSLMLRCGLRIAEVARLHLTDLYLNETLPRLVVRGKGNRERAVYLSPEAERALRAWLRDRPPANSGAVFLSYLERGRPARLPQTIKRFWSVHTCIFRWLVVHHPFSQPLEIKRQHILAYLDQRLAAGLAVSSVNYELRCLQAVLRYLQEQDYAVSQAVLRMPGLKPAARLPRFLTETQVIRLRDELERGVTGASPAAAQRDALLLRATFYLLWQGGLRLGEVEELLLAEVDLAGRRLTVRQGKGNKDRTVYLTDRAVAALQAYLEVRGPGLADHVFLYHTRPLAKDIIRDRLKAAGQRVGVKVSPHQLRHTFATQLLNAGCRVTSIQQLLGHNRLDSTLIYARVYNRTVAQDYYTAMAKVEQQLNLVSEPEPQDGSLVWSLLDELQAEPLTDRQQEMVQQLQNFILTLEKLIANIPVGLPISTA